MVFFFIFISMLFFDIESGRFIEGVFLKIDLPSVTIYLRPPVSTRTILSTRTRLIHAPGSSCRLYDRSTPVAINLIQPNFLR